MPRNKLSLLRRLNTLDESNRQSLSEVDVVAEHLADLLMTRKGAVGIQSDYGLSEMTLYFHQGKAGINRLLDEITQIITKFEPRLENIRVTGYFSESLPTQIEVLIQAHLKQQPVRYYSVLSQQGCLSVRN